MKKPFWDTNFIIVGLDFKFDRCLNKNTEFSACTTPNGVRHYTKSRLFSQTLYIIVHDVKDKHSCFSRLRLILINFPRAFRRFTYYTAYLHSYPNSHHSLHILTALEIFFMHTYYLWSVCLLRVIVIFICDLV